MTINLAAMLLNYLKLTIRLLLRNPSFTIINLLGLSNGFAVFFILWQHAQNELESDQFHRDYARIFRLCYTWSFIDSDGNPDKANVSRLDPEVARLVAGDFEEIEELTRILIQWNFRKKYLGNHDGNIFFSYVDRTGTTVTLKESNVVYADSNVFTFFAIPVIKGDPRKILQHANSVAISEKTAGKYFGNDDPIGKILLLNGKTPFLISGVFKSLPVNSHLDFEIAISTKTLEKAINTNSFGQFFCYYKLRRGVLTPGLERKISDVLTYKNYLIPYFKIYHNISILLSTPDPREATIQQIQKIYSEVFPGNVFDWSLLNDRIGKEYNREKTERNQIILFTSLAICIACVGLPGMFSLKVVQKTKEIGIRKVLGAQLFHIGQILLNSTIKQVIFASLIGIPLGYYLAKQYLEKFSERISLSWWHYALPVMMLLVIMFVTIASTLLKAAKTNPVDSLRYE